MVARKIFIASAGESKSLAKVIAQKLADSNYHPLRWWEEFPTGSVTLDRLKELALSVDGAVFLCTSVDQTWSKDELHHTPRDNVLFEFGLFVGALGRQKAIIIADDMAKLPSDFAAITHGLISANCSTTAERVVEHFDRVFLPSPRPETQDNILVSDPALVLDLLKEVPPRDWHQRTLYVGFDGARRWLAMEASSDYRSKQESRNLNRLLLNAVSYAEARSFVSLGPGDAEIDLEIAMHLREQDPSILYIPIDISHGLVQRAAKQLGEFVSVPAAILGDFEDGLPFILRQVKKHGIPPFLVSLLGNTLGNVDGYERFFLQNLSSLLSDRDTLLISVSIKGPEWSLETDRRFQHSGYSRLNREFIVNGLARQIGVSAKELLAQFETRVVFQPGGTDVPGAAAIDILDSQSGRLITSVRRYDWGSLLTWLKQEMRLHVLYADEVAFNAQLGYGVALLARSFSGHDKPGIGPVPLAATTR